MTQIPQLCKTVKLALPKHKHWFLLLMPSSLRKPTRKGNKYNPGKPITNDQRKLKMYDKWFTLK